MVQHSGAAVEWPPFSSRDSIQRFDPTIHAVFPCLCVLLVTAWIFPGCCGFLSHSKDVQACMQMCFNGHFLKIVLVCSTVLVYGAMAGWRRLNELNGTFPRCLSKSLRWKVGMFAYNCSVWFYSQTSENKPIQAWIQDLSNTPICSRQQLCHENFQRPLSNQLFVKLINITIAKSPNVLGNHQ